MSSVASPATADNFEFACQLATVGTNASGGYSTTIEEDQPLTSVGLDVILDGDCDGTCTTTTSALWGTNTNSGFGYCLEDVTGNPAETADGTDWASANQCDDATPFFKVFPETPATPEPVMASAGPISGDQIRMGVKVSFGAAQAAGAYTNTLTFIATPTF